MAFDDTDQPNKVKRDNDRGYFLPKLDLKKYNVLIDSRNFYDQPISDQTRKYNELRNVAIGKGDDFTTGCFIDYDYFLKHYQLVAIDLSKQKELDADRRAIQKVEFNCMLSTKSQVSKSFVKNI